VRSVVRAIRRGGLALTKAPRIKATLRSLAGRGVALDDPRALADMDDRPLWDLLVGLPGVGPKTAACVLLFSLDRPHFPVDTHVHRVSIRLGLVSERATAVAAQLTLQAETPPELVYPLHMGLIRHGREVCVARRPFCSECVLVDLCPRVGVIDPR
jgi:endonuclease-3